MPDFEFTNPEGRRFTVTGPAGATTEQAWSVLQQHLGSANNQRDSGDRRPNDPVASQDRTINISSTDGSKFPEGNATRREFSRRLAIILRPCRLHRRFQPIP
jgi:hypothetical protein